MEKRQMKHNIYLASPIGRLYLEADGEAVTALYIDSCGEENESDSEILQEAKKQLDEYFAGTRKRFTVPVHFNGTHFQNKVWNALLDIPYGETCCYADVAARIGNPKACRAIGGAVNKNPIMIIVPCHRVIGKNGKLVGFGAGLDIKEKLLELEN